jgi:hypothetical protein
VKQVEKLAKYQERRSEEGIPVQRIREFNGGS